MKENTGDNTMITTESTEAIRLLVDAVTTANPNSSKYHMKNYSLIAHYIQMVNNSNMYTTEEKQRIIRALGSYRRKNQLNAEDLAKMANSLELGTYSDLIGGIEEE